MNNIFTYLIDLEKNNNREWYHENKQRYKTCESEFLDIVQSLIYDIGSFDNTIIHNEPKKLIYRLTRDTRFSHDKSPYNPSFRCSIHSNGKGPIPTGYYLSIKPNNQSFLGGGLFADMFKEATTSIRKYIFENQDEFLNIINDEKFKNNFIIQGTSLKNVPTEYPKDCKVSEYLKNKSWYIEYKFDDNLLIDKEAFIKFAVEKFEAMKPFNDFLNKALKDFKMPTRK